MSQTASLREELAKRSSLPIDQEQHLAPAQPRGGHEGEAAVLQQQLVAQSGVGQENEVVGLQQQLAVAQQ